MQTDLPESSIRPLQIPSAGQNQADAALAALDEIAAQYCRELRRALPFLTRQRARVSPGEAAPASDESALTTAGGPGFWIKLESPERVWAALLFDGAAVLALVDGLFRTSTEVADEDGAAPLEDHQRPALGETLTLAQKALLNRLSTDIAAPLQNLAEHYCHAKLAIVERASLRREESPELPLDAVAVECRVEDVPNPWSIRLFMGAGGIRAGARDAAAEASAGQFDMSTAALRIPVTVVAELGRLTLKLSQVLGLRSGDTLRLPAAANDPVVVRVEGVPKFDAVPVISRGQVAVKIQSRHCE